MARVLLPPCGARAKVRAPSSNPMQITYQQRHDVLARDSAAIEACGQPLPIGF